MPLLTSTTRGNSPARQVDCPLSTLPVRSKCPLLGRGPGLAAGWRTWLAAGRQSNGRQHQQASAAPSPFFGDAGTAANHAVSV
jgi:hypothetical protein